MLDVIVNVSRLSPFFAALITIFIGSFVYSVEKTKYLNKLFLTYCSLLSFWALGCFFQSVVYNEKAAYIWDVSIYSVAVFFPLILLKITSIFIQKEFKGLYPVLSITSISLLLCNWFWGFRTGVNFNFGARYVTTPDFGWYLYLSYFSIVFTFCLIQLIKRLKEVPKEQKTTFKLLIVSMIILLSAGNTYFTLILIKISPLVDSLLNLSSSVFLGIYSLIMSYLIVKEEIFDVSFTVTRTLSTFFVSTLVTFIIITVTFALSDYLIIQIFFISLITVLLTLYGKDLLIKCQTYAEKKFLKGSYNFQDTILNVTNSFTTCQNIKEAIENVHKIFFEQMDIANTKVYLPVNYDVKRSPSLPLESWELQNEKLRKGAENLTKDHHILKLVETNKTVQTLNDNQSKPALIIPFYENETLLGIITADEKYTKEKFSNYDLTIFNTIQRQLPATIIKLNKSLESAAIDIVQSMQLDMLPKPKTIEGYSLDWHYHSAEKVGGDYFDIIQPENTNATYLILGDTVDHGLASGIIALKVRSIVNAILTNKPDISARELNYLTNTILSEELEGVRSRLPVSIIFFKITKEKITFSGHHNELYIYRDKTKTIEEKEVDQFLMNIGEIILPLEDFGEGECTLEENDILFAYSDGIIEAPKDGISTGEQFGEEKTKTFLIDNASRSAEEIKEQLIKDINIFTKETFLDDFCFVLLKKHKPKA